MSVNEKFKEFTAKNYPEQGQAFLNAYWDEMEGETEFIWNWSNEFSGLDLEKGKAGSDLDEFNAHRFLEKLGETRTIREMRDELREIDIDFNKRMALIEYLLVRYKKPITEFVSRPQGNLEEIEKAQHALEEAQRCLQESQEALAISQRAAEIASEEAALAKRDADEARKRAEEAERRAAEAKRDAELAKKSEMEAKAAAEEAGIKAEEARLKVEDATEKYNTLLAAEEELKAALDDLHRQEDEYNSTCQRLKARSEDQSLGVVQRNKASNEVAQLLSQDPLPLRQAKITTEAATKKS